MHKLFDPSHVFSIVHHNASLLAPGFGRQYCGFAYPRHRLCDDDVCYWEDDLVELILSLPEGPGFCRDLIHIPSDVTTITQPATVTTDYVTITTMDDNGSPITITDVQITIVNDLTRTVTDTSTYLTTGTVTEFATETIAQPFTNTATERVDQTLTNNHTETLLLSYTDTNYATSTLDVTATQTYISTSTHSDWATVTDATIATSTYSVTSITVLTEGTTTTVTTVIPAPSIHNACSELDLQPETTTVDPTAAGGSLPYITQFVTVWETVTATVSEVVVTATDVVNNPSTVTLDVFSTIETDISLTETTTATDTFTKDHVTTITDSATLDITAWATTVATVDVTTDETFTATIEASTALTTPSLSQ
ncbi:Adg3 homolog [Talaromyces pinophilus]|uniref:Adg3 homolog n=1 Tax=Talaromyces pinophilus TaxID=128442 RepID=A0A478EDB3_TALPI|nr:Adg3 homolog [Talaromyces pinophilus]